MAQLPRGPGPILIRSRGRARPPGQSVTAPAPAAQGKPGGVVLPTPTSTPALPPSKRPRSPLYRYLADNAAALKVAGGGEPTGDALAKIATASDAQAAANAGIATAIQNIDGSLGKPVTLGTVDRGLLNAIGDRLNEMKTALGGPLTFGDNERAIFSGIKEKLGRVAMAIESDGGKPSIGGAAILAIAIGGQGHRNETVEGQWLGAAKFDTLSDIASVEAEDFADRLLAVREDNAGLLGSELVANATRSTLLFMHSAALVALKAIPKKFIKPLPKKT
jgi:hypothetical protein